MAWKILQPEQPNLPTVKQDLSLADAIAAKTNSRLNTIIEKISEAPKDANDNMEAPKAANDNASVWSTSGKVEVPSTESRLDELRKALGKYTEETETTEAEMFEDHTPEQEVRVPTKEEQMPEPVMETKQPEVKASFSQYTSLSGIDVNNLPKNVPEAKGIMSMSAKYEIQNNLKEEMGVWRARRENVQWASEVLSSREGVDEWTKEYFQTLIAANNSNISKINTKAEGLIKVAEEEMGHLGEVGEVDETATRAFATLEQMRVKGFEFPAYKGSDGGLFAKSFSPANDNSAEAFISALKKAA